MFFFFFDESNSEKYQLNDEVFQLRNRQDVLELEVKLMVLRLLQMRSSKGSNIKSVKCHGVELSSIRGLDSLDLPTLTKKEIETYISQVGYEYNRRIEGHSRVYSKNDIEVNGKAYGIRCLDHTERPIINHSTRDKYEKLCKKVELDIRVLDTVIDSYWRCREAGIFNEDCIYTSDLNPFLEIKDFLRTLLTYISFHAYDISKNFDDPCFELETLDGYIDYTNPCDESTWDVLSEDTFFDKVWKHLRFSFRADRGMPNGGRTMPRDYSIRRWTHEWINKHGRMVYKGALHIRISKYHTAINETPFEELFINKYKEEIQKVRINQGEKDEYLIKLFLLDCRRKRLAIPLGNKTEIVRSVSSKVKEYKDPIAWLNWEETEPEYIVSICKQIGAGKAGSNEKADVFINGIGVSVKSRRGAPPSIINQTTREKILRVMKVINSPIAPLDRIVNRYWSLRFNGGGEDVSGVGIENPFTTGENGESNLSILKPLLNYFTFRGTGARDSNAPAALVLSMGIPNDTTTWQYYTEENFVESVWEKLVFSIRAKGVPQIITDEMQPWIREADGKLKGALNVRVK